MCDLTSEPTSFSLPLSFTLFIHAHSCLTDSLFFLILSRFLCHSTKLYHIFLDSIYFTLFLILSPSHFFQFFFLSPVFYFPLVPSSSLCSCCCTLFPPAPRPPCTRGGGSREGPTPPGAKEVNLPHISDANPSRS